MSQQVAPNHWQQLHDEMNALRLSVAVNKAAADAQHAEGMKCIRYQLKDQQRAHDAAIVELQKKQAMFATRLQSDIIANKDTIDALSLRLKTAEEDLQDVKLHVFGQVSIPSLLSFKSASLSQSYRIQSTMAKRGLQTQSYWILLDSASIRRSTIKSSTRLGLLMIFLG